MPNPVIKTHLTTFHQAATLLSCIQTGYSTQEHNFTHLGMCGLPIEDDPEMISVVNRYHCTKCLLMVDVEDHKVKKSDSGLVPATIGRVQ